jgi:hypothetical protein
MRTLFIFSVFALVASFNRLSAQNQPAVRTANQPKKVIPAKDGSLLLSADVGKGVGPKIAYMPEESAFGWFTAADKVEWDVEVSNHSKYTVYLEWAVDDSEAGKPFILETKGQQLHGTVNKTGSWQSFKTKKIGVINLSEGTHKLVFRPASKFETIGDKGALLDLRGLKLVPVK